MIPRPVKETKIYTGEYVDCGEYIYEVVGAVGRVLAVRSSPKFRDFTAGTSKPHRKISATMGRSGKDKGRRVSLPDGTSETGVGRCSIMSKGRAREKRRNREP